MYLTRNDWTGTWPTIYGELGEKMKADTMPKQPINSYQLSQNNIYQDDPNADADNCFGE